MRYDALNRATQVIYPEDVEGQCRVLRPDYNRAGVLERVMLNDEVFVEQIAYNAKGQRTLIAYGNGVMTRYAYDPLTFRLARLRSERYSQPAAHTFQPTTPGQPLQDFAYDFDLMGNITTIHDRTPESGIPNTPLGTDALDRVFTYEPIYRLRSATGREQATLPDEPWVDFPKSQDVSLTRAYTQSYLYDRMGNIEQLQHTAPSGSFTRGFTNETESNRLVQVTIGPANLAYTYDSSGNMIREATTRHFEWNHSNQMRVFRTQTEGAEPSIYAFYLYDAAGMRVKKLVRRQGGAVSTTVYIDGLFEHQVEDGLENNSLHVMDDQQRIALVRVGPPFPDDTTPNVKFHLGDHLGSSNVVLDDGGSVVNREEYTPYGETSFGSFARKRYRFTGKERDEESGLNYHGARYYASWLGRWTSSDPGGMVDGINTFIYSRNNPILLSDPSGLLAEPPTDNTTGSDDINPNLGVSDCQYLGCPDERYEDNPLFPEEGPGTFGKQNSDPDGNVIDEGPTLSERLDAIPEDFMRNPTAYWPVIGPLLHDLPRDLGDLADAIDRGQYLEAVGYLGAAASDVAIAGLDVVSAGEASKTGHSVRLLAETGKQATAHSAKVALAEPKVLGPVSDAPSSSSQKFREVPNEKKIERQRIAEKTGEYGKVTQLPPKSEFHEHHLFPQAEEFRPQWERLGIDIEMYKINVWGERHLNEIHSKKGISNPGGLWNETWRDFFAKNPDATLVQVFNQLDVMRASFGI